MPEPKNTTKQVTNAIENPNEASSVVNIPLNDNNKDSIAANNDKQEGSKEIQELIENIVEAIDMDKDKSSSSKESDGKENGQYSLFQVCNNQKMLIEELRKKNVENEKKINEQKELIDNTKQENTVLISAQEKLQNIIDGNKKELKRVQAETKAMKEQYDEELVETRKQYRQGEVDRNRLREENNSLHDLRNINKSKIESLEKEVNVLKEKNKENDKARDNLIRIDDNEEDIEEDKNEGEDVDIDEIFARATTNNLLNSFNRGDGALTEVMDLLHQLEKVIKHLKRQ